MNREALTNVYWGLFVIWLGTVTALKAGDFGSAIESPLFALGTGALLLLLNATRAALRQRVSQIAVGLGIVVVVIYAPLFFLGINLPFLSVLLVIIGIALVIGAVRTGKYYG